MPIDDEKFAAQYLRALTDLLPKLDAAPIARAARWLREAEAAGRTVFTCGNGGSASIASQMVVDMVKGASMCSGGRFKMIGLADSVSTITACANDLSYEAVFVEPLKVYGERGDVLIAISGSGNSANVLRAVEHARLAGIRTIGITSAVGGRLKDIVDLPLLVPTDHMGRLEDCFFVITHVLCYACMEKPS